MNTPLPLTSTETQARAELVRLAKSMLAGNTSFFEGAVIVLQLRREIEGIQERDPDFDAFVVIESETDHLPLQAQQHLWNSDAPAQLAPEFVKTEHWAKSFAPAACHQLIARFQAVDY